MKLKKGSVTKIFGVAIFLGIMLLMLGSLTSASWWDYVKAGITGRAPLQTFDLNISVGNTAPNITNITFSTTNNVFDPVELNTSAITFNFTVVDIDGTANINTASAKANATYTNGSQVWVSKNDSCVFSSTLTSTSSLFNCTLRMWYFYPGGDQASQNSVWNLSIFVSDNSGTNGTNTTANFSYTQLKAIVISPASFTFSSIAPSNTNKTSTNDPLIVNNTGNYGFGPTTGNISVNATNLVGETNSLYSLYAGNFTVGTATGQGVDVECGNSTWSHFMSRSVYVNLTTSNSTLSYGNLSLGNGVAQSNLYICLTKVGSEISSQAYSTGGPNSQGSWRVKVQ